MPKESHNTLLFYPYKYWNPLLTISSWRSFHWNFLFMISAWNNGTKNPLLYLQQSSWNITYKSRATMFELLCNSNMKACISYKPSYRHYLRWIRYFEPLVGEKHLWPTISPSEHMRTYDITSHLNFMPTTSCKLKLFSRNTLCHHIQWILTHMRASLEWDSKK